MTLQLEVGRVYVDGVLTRWRCTGPTQGPLARDKGASWDCLRETDGAICSFTDDGQFVPITRDRDKNDKRYDLERVLDRGLVDALAPPPPTDQQKAEPAWKQDGGKARMDLLAPEFLDGTAKVLAFGAAKYAERNWEKGMSWGRCFGAMMRHMWAWWAGERNDPETGLSHLYHAACCLMFLAAYEERGVGVDDRRLTN